ncbi:MAG TPA: X2-like carbohydrate binding domain-containing protein [Lachnospiraceae bacterium]|nr:X2-like carbohydrate binding domain-containing protein [Lachnospiraceae bacterium]
MRNKKQNVVISVLMTLALLVSIPQKPMMAAEITSSTSVTTEPYTWQNAQIGGGGYVDDIIFNYGEKDLIYARTDMGGAYRWDPTTSTWIPITDSIGFEDWNNLGCDSLATDPLDPNRVYIQAGTYTNKWADANGCILRSTDKGETWEKTELPFKVGANMLGRSMGERLAIDPNSNNILFMGTRCGNGLWKSTDYGVTWSKVESFTEVGTFKPTDIASDTYDDTLTGVVWVTYDTSSSSVGTPCQRIFVGVANRAKDGGAAENTVFVSNDGGKTWSAVEGQPKDGYLPHHGVLASNGMLYITYSDGVGPYDGTKGDVWKYNTSTGVWTRISPVPSSSNDDYFGYGGLSVDARNPNTLVVTTLNCWWPDANIYRSTDGGSTWTSFWQWNGYPTRILRYTQDISLSPWLTFGKQDNPPEPALKIGWMMGNISIDPFDSDRMFYGTGATVYGTDNLTAIDSGGKVNLSVKSIGIEQTAVLSLISPTTGTAHLVSGLGDVTGFVHEDVTKVPSMMMITPNFSTTTSMDYAELNPTKYVRVGNTEKGTNPRIGISYDGGKNWSSLSNCWTSSSTDQTGGGKVAMSADGNTIVWAPNGANLQVCYSSNGSSWRQCAGIPSNATIASDRVNPKKFYAYADGKFYVSTDGGATFTATVTSGIPNTTSIADLPSTALVSIKAMPGVEGDIWLVGGSNKVSAYGMWHSTDSGLSFTKLENVQEADVIGFGKAAPGQSYMALYASAKINDVRGIFRSDDAGTTWIRINDDRHQYGRINMCITGDPRLYGRVYVGTNGRGIVYGDTASTQANSSISPSSATFDKKTTEQKDVSVALTMNGNTLSAIRNGTTELALGNDYIVNGTTVSISKSYLARQVLGTTNLTFDFSAGIDPLLSIVIKDTTTTTEVDSSIAPTTASFDRNIASQNDIPIELTLNGNTLTTITNGTYVLTKDTDYTLLNNLVTIKKEYLSKLPVGMTNLNFDFSTGVDRTLSITITDSTPVTVGNLEIQMYNSGKSESTQSISPQIKLVNHGTTDINLSEIKIRYYFTSDQAPGQNFWCDWASVGARNVTGTFTAMSNSTAKADCYLEIGFNSSAGSVAAGSSAVLQVRVTKSDWSTYTQTNDYSFNTDAASYVAWDKVTCYSSGVLQWGMEP